MKKKRRLAFREWTPFDVSPTITPKAGIKLQSNRSASGQQWWSKRWIAQLESFDIGARLGRGKSYARRGQVVSISISKGKVEASVQGSRPRPYQVTISIDPISATKWETIVKEISTQAIFAAKLLAGVMPETVESLFLQAGCSLFPEREKDLATDCTCPDWSNPCKHIAAVYYLLGQEIDRDPFLLFRLRGMERRELLQRLGLDRKRLQTVLPNPENAPVSGKEPLSIDPAIFWGRTYESLRIATAISVPSRHAALTTQLGPFPFWRGTDNLFAVLEDVYESSSEAGMNLIAGECDGVAQPVTSGYKPGKSAAQKTRYSGSRK